jgi:hypothetical protein
VWGGAGGVGEGAAAGQEAAMAASSGVDAGRERIRTIGRGASKRYGSEQSRKDKAECGRLCAAQVGRVCPSDRPDARCASLSIYIACMHALMSDTCPPLIKKMHEANVCLSILRYATASSFKTIHKFEISNLARVFDTATPTRSCRTIHIC